MKKRRFISLCLFLAFTLLYSCGGGGSSGGGSNDDDDSQASLQATPADYDFGGVTPGNDVAPLEVKIENSNTNRSARALAISGIKLSDETNFDLDINGGSKPCGTLTPDIRNGKYCTVVVSFTPTGEADYSAKLTIDTQDSGFSPFIVNLKAISEPVTDIKVDISQVESDDACPAAQITAYVAVTDQWDFPVNNLTKADFEITEDSNKPVFSDPIVVSDDTDCLSVAMVMDYSGSISKNPEIKGDLEAAAKSLVDDLGPDDEAEIIKFGSKVKVMQKFTSDKAKLKDAIAEDPDFDTWTRLYDAVWKGINDVDDKDKTQCVRKAVVLLSDGKDIGPDDEPLSDKTIDQVIEDAQNNGISGIPIFSIGLGNFDTDPLKEMAGETGGIFYESSESDNLDTIYEQVGELLFTDQYVIKYKSALADGDSGDLKIKAVYSVPIVDTDTRSITPCP